MKPHFCGCNFNIQTAAVDFAPRRLQWHVSASELLLWRLRMLDPKTILPPTLSLYTIRILPGPPLGEISSTKNSCRYFQLVFEAVVTPTWVLSFQRCCALTGMGAAATSKVYKALYLLYLGFPTQTRRALRAGARLSSSPRTTCEGTRAWAIRSDRFVSILWGPRPELHQGDCLPCSKGYLQGRCRGPCCEFGR